MKTFFYIFIGGGIGSVLRFVLSKYMIQFWHKDFPTGTLIVNLIGCFLIGVLFTYFTKYPTPTIFSWLLIAGFCGGFTTFSTFSLESIVLLEKNQYSIFTIYILSSLLGGISLSFLGAKIASYL